MLRPRLSHVVGAALLVAALFVANVQAQTPPKSEYRESRTPEANDTSWNFDGDKELPAGWKVEATNQKGPLATWRVIKDRMAPSSKNALAMVSPNHDFDGTFNICWTKDVRFLNGAIEVNFKAVEGMEDQGGPNSDAGRQRDAGAANTESAASAAKEYGCRNNGGLDHLRLAGIIIPISGLVLPLFNGESFSRARSVLNRTAGDTVLYAIGAGAIAASMPRSGGRCCWMGRSFLKQIGLSLHPIVGA